MKPQLPHLAGLTPGTPEYQRAQYAHNRPDCKRPRGPRNPTPQSPEERREKNRAGHRAWFAKKMEDPAFREKHYRETAATIERRKLNRPADHAEIQARQREKAREKYKDPVFREKSKEWSRASYEKKSKARGIVPRLKLTPEERKEHRRKYRAAWYIENKDRILRLNEKYRCDCALARMQHQEAR